MQEGSVRAACGMLTETRRGDAVRHAEKRRGEGNVLVWRRSTFGVKVTCIVEWGVGQVV